MEIAYIVHSFGFVCFIVTVFYVSIIRTYNRNVFFLENRACYFSNNVRGNINLLFQKSRKTRISSIEVE